MIVTSIFVTLIVLMILRVPIAVALGLSSVAGLLTSGINLEIIALKIVGANNSFPLLAIPFFILGGRSCRRAECRAV